MKLLMSLIFTCVPYLDGGMLCRQGDEGGPFVIVPKGQQLQIEVPPMQVPQAPPPVYKPELKVEV